MVDLKMSPVLSGFLDCLITLSGFLKERVCWGRRWLGEGSSLGPGLPRRSLLPKTSHHFLPNPSAESENPAGLTSPPQVCVSLFLSLAWAESLPQNAIGSHYLLLNPIYSCSLPLESRTHAPPLSLPPPPSFSSQFSPFFLVRTAFTYYLSLPYPQAVHSSRPLPRIFFLPVWSPSKGHLL